MGQSGLGSLGRLEHRCERKEELVKGTENDRQRDKVHCHSRDHGAKSTRGSRVLEGPGGRGCGHQEGGGGGGAVQTQVSSAGETLEVGGIRWAAAVLEAQR